MDVKQQYQRAYQIARTHKRTVGYDHLCKSAGISPDIARAAGLAIAERDCIRRTNPVATGQSVAHFEYKLRVRAIQNPRSRQRHLAFAQQNIRLGYRFHMFSMRQAVAHA